MKSRQLVPSYERDAQSLSRNPPRALYHRSEPKAPIYAGCIVIASCIEARIGTGPGQLDGPWALEKGSGVLGICRYQSLLPISVLLPLSVQIVCGRRAKAEEDVRSEDNNS